jgi:hypothetical protein
MRRLPPIAPLDFIFLGLFTILLVWDAIVYQELGDLRILVHQIQRSR